MTAGPSSTREPTSRRHVHVDQQLIISSYHPELSLAQVHHYHTSGIDDYIAKLPFRVISKSIFKQHMMERDSSLLKSSAYALVANDLKLDCAVCFNTSYFNSSLSGLTGHVELEVEGGSDDMDSSSSSGDEAAAAEDNEGVQWSCESECTAGPYRHTNSCIPTCWQRPMRESQRVSEGCHVVLYTVSFYQNASRLNHVNVRRVADQQYDSLRGAERMPYHRNANMSSGTSTDQAAGTRDSTVLTLSNYRSASVSSEGLDVKVCAVAFIAANSLLSRMMRANSSAYFGNWAVVEVDFNDYPDSTLVSLGNPRKVSRLPKISPGLFFASTVHHALYIDSKLEFIDDPLTMMGFKDRKTTDRKTRKRVNVTAAFVAVRHELSHTIYEEGEHTDSNTTLPHVRHRAYSTSLHSMRDGSGGYLQGAAGLQSLCDILPLRAEAAGEALPQAGQAAEHVLCECVRGGRAAAQPEVHPRLPLPLHVVPGVLVVGGQGPDLGRLRSSQQRADREEYIDQHS
jgi:hypothetical protein